MSIKHVYWIDVLIDDAVRERNKNIFRTQLIDAYMEIIIYKLKQSKITSLAARSYLFGFIPWKKYYIEMRGDEVYAMKMQDNGVARIHPDRYSDFSLKTFKVFLGI